MRRTVTVLTMAMKGRGLRADAFGLEQGEYRRRMHRLALDAWEMLLALLEAEQVEIPRVDMDCYEERFEDGQEAATATAYPRFGTCQELVEGYGRDWRWTMFNPDRFAIDGAKVWCMLLEETQKKPNGTIRGLVVPVSAFVEVFQCGRAQLRSRAGPECTPDDDGTAS